MLPSPVHGQKKVRFPKGKKVKRGDDTENIPRESGDDPNEWIDPDLVARARAKRQKKSDLRVDNAEDEGDLKVVASAEMHYKDDENLIDEGIEIEPFNLTKEREEGYFDEAGNYVEYIDDKEIKDAWLDSLDVDPKYAGKSSVVVSSESDAADLSFQDRAGIKRRIADVLEPGETVLLALRRLKGNSNDKKEKMPAEIKLLFDQLTEDAMKLMEDGDYDVYDEKQEAFQREAEGLESILRARGQSTSIDSGNRNPDFAVSKDFVRMGKNAASISASNSHDAFDMFAEEDDNAVSNVVPSPNPDGVGQPSESGTLQDDYLFDESSGYYYSSSLGYYYDPSSQLYCYAASGLWYSYNQETGTYDEIPAVEANAT